MCGIAGFTHRNWSPDPDRIRRAAATLVHRGPDQQGVFRSEICSLGATRLKIIDLEGGDQPIFSPNGDAVIVFNGEIYNHLELRAELESLGHRFKSHSDTETVLHAFLEWDTQCFARLRGMFAIALWTESSAAWSWRAIAWASSRSTSRSAARTSFGSELKAMFIHPEIERRLSLAGLDCYLSLNYVPCPWTLVEGIEKLPPGNWLEWRDGKIRSDSYWQLPFENPPQLDSRFRESRARLAAATIHARASALRRAAGRLAERRHRFLHDPALRRASLHVAPENFFDFLPRPQLR